MIDGHEKHQTSLREDVDDHHQNPGQQHCGPLGSEQDLLGKMEQAVPGLPDANEHGGGEDAHEEVTDGKDIRWDGHGGGSL